MWVWTLGLSYLKKISHPYPQVHTSAQYAFNTHNSFGLFNRRWKKKTYSLTMCALNISRWTDEKNWGIHTHPSRDRSVRPTEIHHIALTHNKWSIRKVEMIFHHLFIFRLKSHIFVCVRSRHTQWAVLDVVDILFGEKWCHIFWTSEQNRNRQNFLWYTWPSHVHGRCFIESREEKNVRR